MAVVPGSPEPASAAPLAATTTPPTHPAATSPPPEETLALQMKWSGKTYDLVFSASDLVYDLRTQIETKTSVPTPAQKILGLTKGKLSPDLDPQPLSTLNIKSGTKFTLIGTPEHLRIKERATLPEDGPDVDYAAEHNIDPATDPRNLRRVEQLVSTLPVTLMNEPREGSRLLVLDIDYTIVDTRPMMDGALPSVECARPGLHAFLELVYPYYDIVLWSQTHWRWLEIKLVELGIIGGDAPYKIAFVADRSTMFPIFSKRKGEMVKHEVKPLAYFWKQFPQWGATNSIHIDDLSRNFAMNPGEGLKIRAFKGAATMEGQSDRELDKLGQYLKDIATVKDFTTLDHSVWKHRVKAIQVAARAADTAKREASESRDGNSGNGSSSG